VKKEIPLLENPVQADFIEYLTAKPRANIWWSCIFVLRCISRVLCVDCKAMVLCGQVPAEDRDCELGTAPLTALLRPIEDARVTMDSVIGGYNIGETAAVLAVNHAAVSSYLLAWNLLLSLFRRTSSEQRVEYARYIRRVGLIDRLMSDVFRLLPNSPVIPVSNALLSLPSSNKVCVGEHCEMTS